MDAPRDRPRAGADERFLAPARRVARAGSHRLDANGDNVYEHSAAVALMDAWWPRFVRAQFEPALGKELFDTVEDRVLGLGGFGWDWAHPRPEGPAQRAGPARARALLAHLLRRPGPGQAQAQGAHGRARSLPRDPARHAARRRWPRSGEQGADPAGWKVPATCADTDPPSCDQNVPTTAGAVDTPPFPWQNRGTFHQVDEVLGHR